MIALEEPSLHKYRYSGSLTLEQKEIQKTPSQIQQRRHLSGSSIMC